jgi:hypothetical protein
LTASLIGFFIIPFKAVDNSLKKFIEKKNESFGAEKKAQDFQNLIRLKRLEAIQKAAKSKSETYEFIIDVDVEQKGGNNL